MNVTNLVETKGRTTIKQGDFASPFAFELQDSEGQKMTELDGETVEISFENASYKVAYRTTATVEEGVATFKIDNLIEPGRYNVEMRCNGFIFPAGSRQTLVTVTAGHNLTGDGNGSKIKVSADMSGIYRRKRGL